MKLFEHWLHYSFDWKSLGLALLIVVISIVLVNGIVRGIFHQIEKRIPDRFAGWTDVLMAFENPARVIVLFTGLLIALHTAHAPHLVTHFAHAIYRSVLMFSIGYGLYKLMGSLTVLLGHLGSRINFELDSIVMPFLTRSLQFVVMALTVTMILSDWGINVNGVLFLWLPKTQSRTCLVVSSLLLRSHSKSVIGLSHHLLKESLKILRSVQRWSAHLTVRW